MRLKTNRKASVLTLLLLVTFVASGFLFGPVHAAAPNLVQSLQSPGLSDGATGVTWPNSGVSSVGDMIVVHVFCMAGGDTVNSVSDAAGSVFTELFHIGRAHVWTGFVKGSTSGIIVNLNCNFLGSPSAAFSAEEFSGVASIGNVVTDSTGCSGACTTTRSITIGINNALVYNIFDVYGGGLGSCPTITNGGSSQITTQTLTCLNGLGGAFSIGRTVYAPNRGIGVNSFSMQTSASQTAAEQLVELDPAGGSPSNLGLQTACYGNCGSPAVSLINTNSTHLTNFNLSISLLYTFQSQLNGQILNVTTNVAKTYSNGIVMTLGIYTIPTCPPGQTPFTNTCPAILQKSIAITNPGKGSNALSAANVPVSAGQWVGLAVTATIAGLDLNDTNTDVSLQQAQANNGILAPSITQTTVIDSLSDVGLWGYITGNTITGVGPPPTAIGGICSGLDCILANVVNSFCTNVTSACQTASSMFWVIILTIISIFVMVFMFNQIVPTVNLGRVGLGELSVLIFIMWIAIFTSFNLMSLYPLAIVFAVTALLLGRKVNSLI